jgi:hypothetical protein
MANSSCPGGNTALPDINTLPIPQNINIMARTGSNTSNHAMETCCEPSPVQVAEGCYLWCEVPQRYFNVSTRNDEVASRMSACLRAAVGGNYTDESRITGWQFNAGARTGMTTAKQIGLWVLLVSGFIYIL